MRDEMDELDRHGDLERVLERFAVARLDPDPETTDRMRARVMAAAWQARLAAQEAARVVPTAPPAPSLAQRLFGPRTVRRAGWAMTAVLSALMVGGTAFATSLPGGPLYTTRLAVEMALMPGDPAARLQAELAYARARLAEAFAASANGDSRALEASLAAYEAVLATVDDATGEGASRAIEAIQTHGGVLEDIADRAPAQAANGISRAQQNSAKAIERLRGRARP